MEFFLFILEKSEKISLTLLMAIMSLFVTGYYHYEKTRAPNPHDLLDGTLTEPLHWIVKGMWFLTLTALILYAGKCLYRNKEKIIRFYLQKN